MVILKKVTFVQYHLRIQDKLAMSAKIFWMWPNVGNHGFPRTTKDIPGIKFSYHSQTTMANSALLYRPHFVTSFLKPYFNVVFLEIKVLNK